MAGMRAGLPGRCWRQVLMPSGLPGKGFYFAKNLPGRILQG